MTKTRSKVLAVLFSFSLVLAGAFVYLKVDSATWGHWFTFNISLVTLWFGSKTFQDFTKSKWYRPEMDDDHPDVQQAAIESLRERFREKSMESDQDNL